MDLSIIIVNYNVFEDVKKCIGSIYNNISRLKFEVIVVDNNSANRDIEKLKEIHPDVKLVLNKDNRGFGYANNIGVTFAEGEFIVLVNQDIIFLDNSLEVMLDYIRNNNNIGAIGPIQVKPNSGIEYYYTFFPSIYSRLMQEFRLYMTAPIMKKRFFNFLDEKIKIGVPFEVDWVMGSCMMLKRKLFNDLGGFDEAFFLYEEETELEYRLKSSGLRNYMHPGARVLHNHHSSASKLGVLFVVYQEFRSRIIFDSKRFRGLKYFFRRFLIIIALFLRVLYFLPKSLLSSDSKKKLMVNFELLKFAARSKTHILNDRFIFEDKQHLFI